MATGTGAPAWGRKKKHVKYEPEPDAFALTGRERLQKFMSHAGLDSRRQCEQMILDGRVRVNGKMVTELGLKVRTVEGQPGGFVGVVRGFGGGFGVVATPAGRGYSVR